MYASRVILEYDINIAVRECKNIGNHTAIPKRLALLLPVIEVLYDRFSFDDDIGRP